MLCELRGAVPLSFRKMLIGSGFARTGLSPVFPRLGAPGTWVEVGLQISGVGDKSVALPSGGDYFTRNTLTTIALGCLPAGSMVKRAPVRVVPEGVRLTTRTTEMSPERVSAASSRCPSAEKARASGPPPTGTVLTRLPSRSEEHTS